MQKMNKKWLAIQNAVFVVFLLKRHSLHIQVKMFTVLQLQAFHIIKHPVYWFNVVSELNHFKNWHHEQISKIEIIFYCITRMILKKMYFVFIEFFHTTKTFDRTLLNWNTIGPGMGTMTENKIINIVPWQRTILTHWLRLPSSCPSTAGVEPQVSLDVDWKHNSIWDK